MNKHFKTYEEAYNFLVENGFTIWEEKDRRACIKSYPWYLGWYNYIIVADDNVCCLRTNKEQDVINYANDEQDIINYANDIRNSLIEERLYDTSFHDAQEFLKSIGYEVEVKLDVDDKIFYDVVDKEGYFIRFYNAFKLIRFAVEKMIFDEKED